MNRSARVWACVLMLLGSALVLPGCGGESTVQVNGRITLNGKPIPVKTPGGILEVLFHPAREKQFKDEVIPRQNAAVNPDGTFTVPGPRGEGIVPGTYRIVVTWKDKGFMSPDMLKGRFSQENSRIIREVTGKEPIDIDVSRPEG